MSCKYKLSKRSVERLLTCNPDLITIISQAIKNSPIDFTVLCGHRGEKEQNEAYAKGNSTLKYPKSKHNHYPSEAIDIAPYPIDWNDIDRFKKLSSHIKQIAAWLDIEIEWGGDWENFKDYPHYQLSKSSV